MTTIDKIYYLIGRFGKMQTAEKLGLNHITLNKRIDYPETIKEPEKAIINKVFQEVND